MGTNVSRTFGWPFVVEGGATRTVSKAYSEYMSVCGAVRNRGMTNGVAISESADVALICLLYHLTLWGEVYDLDLLLVDLATLLCQRPLRDGLGSGLNPHERIGGLLDLGGAFRPCRD